MQMQILNINININHACNQEYKILISRHTAFGIQSTSQQTLKSLTIFNGRIIRHAKHAQIINNPFYIQQITPSITPNHPDTNSMSRCQHGEPITQFCITDTCNWRQPSGCEQCFKKYHNHIQLQNTDILNTAKLQQMYKLYSTKSQIKPKTRILQQAVYNYFIIMKSQISSSIDNISRIITNRLNYPYLYEEGQLSVYRKIKNKEYKKITKKQLKSFYNFTNTQNKDIIELNQKKLYKEEVRELSNIMKGINQSFLLYSKAVEKLDNTFNVERSFLNKIYEIANSIEKSESKSYEKIEKVSTQSQQSVGSQLGQWSNKDKSSKDSKDKDINKEKEKSKGQLKDSRDIKESINITPLAQQPPIQQLQSRPSRERKVSLDYGLAGGIDVNKFKAQPGQISNNSNIDQNEKQIYQRKKKLFDMINNPRQAESSPEQASINNTQKVKQKARLNLDLNLNSHIRANRQQNAQTSKSLQRNMTNMTSLQNTPKKMQQPPNIHPHTHMQECKEIPSPIYEHEDQHMMQSKVSDGSPTAVTGLRVAGQDDEQKTDNNQNIQSNDYQVRQRQRQQRLQTQQTQTQKQDVNQLQPEKANLFEDLMNKGINLPEIIMHTILPRQTSRPKLYQDTKDVKQRKITIPVKRFEDEEEISSPLFKQKKQKKIDREKHEEQEGQQGSSSGRDMGQISLFGKQDEVKEDSFEKDDKQKYIYSTPKKQDERLLLKQKQADSLALLVQSLPLSAQKAIPLLQASIKYAHNNLSAAQYLSYLYLLIQKPKQCLQLCNKFLEQLQDSPQANQLTIHISNNKAAALNMLGRYSQSIGILQKCLAFTKRDIYYKNLGDAYFSIAIYEKAIFNYESAIKMNNQMQQAFYNLAVCYYIQQHMHQAKLNVAKALKINPKNQQYLRLSREIMIKMQV